MVVEGLALFTKDQGPPVSEYVLDDGSPSLFAPEDSVNGTITTFYRSPVLVEGVHTLNISLLTDGVPLYIDLVAYSIDESAAASAMAADSGPRPTIITTIIQAPTSAAMASQNGSSMPVGPIVGGVVGGVALLVSAFLAIYFIYWKPTRDRSAYYYHTTATGDDWDPAGSYERSGLFIIDPC